MKKSFRIMFSLLLVLVLFGCNESLPVFETGNEIQIQTDLSSEKEYVSANASNCSISITSMQSGRKITANVPFAGMADFTSVYDELKEGQWRVEVDVSDGSGYVIARGDRIVSIVNGRRNIADIELDPVLYAMKFRLSDDLSPKTAYVRFAFRSATSESVRTFEVDRSRLSAKKITLPAGLWNVDIEYLGEDRLVHAMERMSLKVTAENSEYDLAPDDTASGFIFNVHEKGKVSGDVIQFDVHAAGPSGAAADWSLKPSDPVRASYDIEPGLWKFSVRMLGENMECIGKLERTVSIKAGEIGNIDLDVVRGKGTVSVDLSDYGNENSLISYYLLTLSDMDGNQIASRRIDKVAWTSQNFKGMETGNITVTMKAFDSKEMLIGEKSDVVHLAMDGESLLSFSFPNPSVPKAYCSLNIHFAEDGGFEDGTVFHYSVSDEAGTERWKGDLNAAGDMKFSDLSNGIWHVRLTAIGNDIITGSSEISVDMNGEDRRETVTVKRDRTSCTVAIPGVVSGQDSPLVRSYRISLLDDQGKVARVSSVGRSDYAPVRFLDVPTGNYKVRIELLDKDALTIGESMMDLAARIGSDNTISIKGDRYTGSLTVSIKDALTLTDDDVAYWKIVLTNPEGKDNAAVEIRKSSYEDLQLHDLVTGDWKIRLSTHKADDTEIGAVEETFTLKRGDALTIEKNSPRYYGRIRVSCKSGGYCYADISIRKAGQMVCQGWLDYGRDYESEPLPVGTYEVIINDHGYEGKRYEVAVKPDETYEIEIEGDGYGPDYPYGGPMRLSISPGEGDDELSGITYWTVVVTDNYDDIVKAEYTLPRKEYTTIDLEGLSYHEEYRISVYGWGSRGERLGGNSQICHFYGENSIEMSVPRDNERFRLVFDGSFMNEHQADVAILSIDGKNIYGRTYHEDIDMASITDLVYVTTDWMNTGEWTLSFVAKDIDGNAIAESKVNCILGETDSFDGAYDCHVDLVPVTDSLIVRLNGLDKDKTTGVSSYRLTLTDEDGSIVVPEIPAETDSGISVKVDGLHSGKWTVLAEGLSGSGEVLGDGTVEAIVISGGDNRVDVPMTRWQGKLVVRIDSSAENHSRSNITRYVITLTDEFGNSMKPVEYRKYDFTEAVFDLLDTGTWNIRVDGYAGDGYSGEELIIFGKDQKAALTRDGVTSNVVLDQEITTGSLDMSFTQTSYDDVPAIAKVHVTLYGDRYEEASTVDCGTIDLTKQTSLHVDDLPEGWYHVDCACYDAKGNRVSLDYYGEYGSAEVYAGRNSSTECNLSGMRADLNFSIGLVCDPHNIPETYRVKIRMVNDFGYERTDEILPSDFQYDTYEYMAGSVAMTTWTVTVSLVDDQNLAVAKGTLSLNPEPWGSSDRYYINAEPVYGKVRLSIGGALPSDPEVSRFEILFNSAYGRSTSRTISRTSASSVDCTNVPYGDVSVVVKALNSSGTVIASETRAIRLDSQDVKVMSFAPVKGSGIEPVPGV